VSYLLENVLVFGRLLRALGLQVHMGRMLDVLDALPLVDLRERDEVYHACRSLLVHRHEDLAVFDRAFAAFWAGPAPLESALRAQQDRGERPAGGGGEARLEMTGDAEAGDAATGALRTWSDAAALAAKDFAEFTEDEIAIARVALDRMRWTPGQRITRRWIAGGGSRLDLRRALSQSVRTGGDLFRLPRRRRRVRPRPIVLLCDVSGSMERYSRMLLHFAHALARRHRSVEAFLFSTRLTRITAQLRAGRLDDAVTAVSRAVPDWSGGTRIGEALRTLHQQWRRRVLHHGPVVILVSDGWDRGDPRMLRDQIARLRPSSG
jgi:uncharacterized protein with von Willebrand factor type A (vWA) domain